jgi:hypothetical protein
MTCLSEQMLLELALGDAPLPAREHARQCDACATRAKALARDLTHLRTVLREAPWPTAPAARSWGVQWTAVAAAAALVLTVVLHRHATMPPTAGEPVTEVALLDELENAMLTDVNDATDANATAGSTASTCTWGDPLLGVGCNEPAATLIAWR